MCNNSDSSEIIWFKEIRSIVVVVELVIITVHARGNLKRVVYSLFICWNKFYMKYNITNISLKEFILKFPN